MTTFTIVAVLLVGLAVGLVLGFFAARLLLGAQFRAQLASTESRAQATIDAADARRDTAVAQASAQIESRAATEQRRLSEQAAAAAARAERLEQENEQLLARAKEDASVLRALEPVQAALKRMDEQVTGMEKARAAQFSALTTRLQAADATDKELQAATTRLEAALRSSSARGSWGEMELRRVLEVSGMTRHATFLEQVHLPGGCGDGVDSSSRPGARPGGAKAGRPDVVVMLPGGKAIAVDAKVPMDAYLRASAIEVVDDATRRERDKLLAEHVKALRGHIDALAARDYAAGMRQALRVDAADLVVAFVPAEGLLAAALDADAGLLEHAARRKVALASPTSLLALLRSAAALWAESHVTEEAREILDLGRELNERLATVASHLDRLGGSLKSSVRNYNAAIGSLEGRVLVSVRRLDSLAEDANKVASPATIDSEAGQVREIIAPELATDGQEADAEAVDSPVGRPPQPMPERSSAL